MKEILFPTRKNNVMSLLKQAGVDVKDWENYKGKNAASNPKYRYEWSFIEPGKVVVLNLWYEDIIEDNDMLFQEKNFREDAIYITNNYNKPVWSRRALKMDHAIQTALKDDLIVRVIICNGKVRKKKVLNAEASKVESRMLDPVPWTISDYNNRTGDCILKRGSYRINTYDQFDLQQIDGTSILNKKEVAVNIYKRSSLVRNKVLSRANNRCEYCNKIGFITNDSRYYLETHHIIPLAESGDDNEMNVVALCPNHHRIAHYGIEKLLIQEQLRKKIKDLYG